MSEEHKGPPMIAATNMLRPPPARIGKISGNITLPRTIELKKAIAAGAGGFGGVFLWFFPLGLIVGYTVFGLLISVLIGGAIGVFAVSWSPLRGESLATWLGLTAGRARSDRVEIDGRPVRAYLGIAPLPFTAAGRTEVFASAVDIPPGSHDDRGVPLDPVAMRHALLAQSQVNPFPGGYPSVPSPSRGDRQGHRPAEPSSKAPLRR